MISRLPLDPAAIVVAYDEPVMIGQGTTDIHVGLTDASTLVAARSDARLAIWEGSTTC